MLKKLFTLFASVSLTVFVSANGYAEVKTSSLSIGKTPVTLIDQCQKMFNLADVLIRDAEKQPGTHTQVAKLKKKLLETKQQVSKMEVALQAKSCDKGLTALNTSKQKH